MKKVLGLDLGTNSIGWALVDNDFERKQGEIIDIGSRIIPMSQDVLGKFDTGQSISQTAERTGYRGVRRLYQRDNLRRERLHRVLKILGFLPKHYQQEIDFKNKLGQFKNEVKLNYRINKEGKYEFIFIDAFNEMLAEFNALNKEIKIPYDWTLYYLRKKALTEKISKEELAWVILNFNQKRGYYQLRGEEEETQEGKIKTFETLVVKELIDSGEKIKKTENILYDVYFENGWKYDKQIVKTENWKNKTKEFIVTTSATKDGKTKRTYKAVDSEKDWIAIKEKAQQNIDEFNKQNNTVGTALYIYDTLLNNPTQKIRGKLIKTIERKYYREELAQILNTQIKLHSELQDRNLYQACINELYPRNEAHQNNIKNKGFDYLFIYDIIFYQRPLKSKKSTISGCQFETRIFKKTVVDKDTKEKKEIFITEPIKAISKSHPLYQEFRLWQFLKNLKIYQKEDEDGNIIADKNADITTKLLQTEEDWVDLFNFLNIKKTIEQHQILKYFSDKKLIPKQKKDKGMYKWNYVEDKKYPANETKAQFLSRLSKVTNINDAKSFLTNETEIKLWQIIYSVKDLAEYEKALKTFAKKNNLNEDSFVSSFVKFPPFKNDYGAFSEKAIKKILPLMRRGHYFDENNISSTVKERVQAIMERVNSLNLKQNYTKEDLEKAMLNVVDDDIPTRLVKSFIPFIDKNPLTGLNTYQASYAIYNRHSESGNVQYWKTPQDIDKYLSNFKQHSLRNPIVEQVVTETLRTVRDIWRYHGNGVENFFNEIHIELGREMKNPADKRKQISEKNINNLNTNIRIKAILQELVNSGVSNIKPYSPSQQEILKIYEESVFENAPDNYKNIKLEDIEKIRKKASPTPTEIERYKIWLEQGYVSPYTGKTIPLTKLFTSDYQIEHIIPQSRYFDNSMNNKVICESEVNQLKDNQTAFEFIKNHGGQIVDLGQGNIAEVYKLAQYESHCNAYFKKNRAKLKNLLSEDIPEGFINRQLTDSRYISKLIKSLLSNIVREEGEQEAIAKNIVPVTGAITSKLKKDWGLHNKWNELIAPRFIRLNKLTGTEDFGYWDNKINAFRIQVPDDILNKGFNKKRIDHRHHALDALVIACCTKDHINYITSINTNRKNHSLVSKLRNVEEIEVTNKKTGNKEKRKVAKAYKLPWQSFPVDAKKSLDKTVVSFKQNLRVINKTNNKTMQWVEKKGKYVKQLVSQTKGDNWAIRKPMHKETVSGQVLIDENKEVSFNKAIEDTSLIIDKTIRIIVENSNIENLKERIEHFKKNPIIIDGNKVRKVRVFTRATAVRTSLVDIKTIKHLKKITDKGIQQILKNHLSNYIDEKGNENYEQAFNAVGVEDLNKNIKKINNGKNHQPIYKVRLYEAGSKFAVGYTRNNNTKYVEAAKGTNLFFAVYWDEKTQKRTYETVPFNEVVEHQKQVAHLPKTERTPIPINAKKGAFLFALSPNDLVYVPTDEEIENPNLVDFKNLTKEQIERIYKMVSTSQGKLECIPNTYSSPIKNNEMGSNNKSQNMIDGKTQIKPRCWKLEINRTGKIINIIS